MDNPGHPHHFDWTQLELIRSGNFERFISTLSANKPLNPRFFIRLEPGLLQQVFDHVIASGYENLLQDFGYCLLELPRRCPDTVPLILRYMGAAFRRGMVWHSGTDLTEYLSRSYEEEDPLFALEFAIRAEDVDRVHVILRTHPMINPTLSGIRAIDELIRETRLRAWAPHNHSLLSSIPVHADIVTCLTASRFTIHLPLEMWFTIFQFIRQTCIVSYRNDVRRLPAIEYLSARRRRYFCR